MLFKQKIRYSPNPNEVLFRNQTDDVVPTPMRIHSETRQMCLHCEGRSKRIKTMEEREAGEDGIIGPNGGEEEDIRWEIVVFVVVAKEERLIKEKSVGGHVRC